MINKTSINTTSFNNNKITFSPIINEKTSYNKDPLQQIIAPLVEFEIIEEKTTSPESTPTPIEQCLTNFFQFDDLEAAKYKDLSIHPGSLLALTTFTHSKQDIIRLLNRCLIKENAKQVHEFFSQLVDHPITNWGGARQIQLTTILKLFDLGILQYRTKAKGERGLVEIWPFYLSQILYFEKFATNDEAKINFITLKELIRKKHCSVKKLVNHIKHNSLHDLIKK